MVGNTGTLLEIQRASEEELRQGTRHRVVLSIGTSTAILREGATTQANHSPALV